MNTKEGRKRQPDIKISEENEKIQTISTITPDIKKGQQAVYNQNSREKRFCAGYKSLDIDCMLDKIKALKPSKRTLEEKMQRNPHV